MSSIRVRATRTGHYVSLRKEGDVFIVASIREIGSWMEPADKTDQKLFDAEFKRRKDLRRAAREGGKSKLQKQAEALVRKTAAKGKSNVDDDLGL